MKCEGVLLVGDEFSIEEMPQGCVLTELHGDGRNTGRSFKISSPKDATIILNSLRKMMDVQYPDFDDSFLL